MGDNSDETVWGEHEFDGECYTGQLGFTINEHGVCINPIEEVILKDKNFDFRISYAYSEKVSYWEYGYWYQFPGPSHSGGCSAPGFGSYHKGYPSKDSARYSAIKWMIRCIAGKIKEYPRHKNKLELTLKKLENMLFGEQLELFN